MGEADDSVDDQRALGVAVQVRHERPVDLERIERQPGQVAQRGKSGTKVVYGEAKTCLPKSRKRCSVIAPIPPTVRLAHAPNQAP